MHSEDVSGGDRDREARDGRVFGLRLEGFGAICAVRIVIDAASGKRRGERRVIEPSVSSWDSVDVANEREPRRCWRKWEVQHARVLAQISGLTVCPISPLLNQLHTGSGMTQRP